MKYMQKPREGCVSSVCPNNNQDKRYVVRCKRQSRDFVRYQPCCQFGGLVYRKHYADIYGIYARNIRGMQSNCACQPGVASICEIGLSALWAYSDIEIDGLRKEYIKKQESIPEDCTKYFLLTLLERPKKWETVLYWCVVREESKDGYDQQNYCS